MPGRVWEETGHRGGQEASDGGPAELAAEFCFTVKVVARHWRILSRDWHALNSVSKRWLWLPCGEWTVVETRRLAVVWPGIGGNSGCGEMCVMNGLKRIKG